MVKQNIIVTNKAGIHARPASMFMDAAGLYKSTITIEKDGKTALAKSLIKILSLSIKQNSEITIIAEGEDEKEALEAMIKLVEVKFGED